MYSVYVVPCTLCTICAGFYVTVSSADLYVTLWIGVTCKPQWPGWPTQLRHIIFVLGFHGKTKRSQQGNLSPANHKGLVVRGVETGKTTWTTSVPAVLAWRRRTRNVISSSIWSCLKETISILKEKRNSVAGRGLKMSQNGAILICCRIIFTLPFFTLYKNLLVVKINVLFGGSN